MPATCTICDWIEAIKKGTHPGFVREMETGYVMLAEYQYFRGYSLFLSKTHVAELHDLPGGQRLRFLEEMSQLSHAVHLAFQPKKLNQALLGNLTPHLHWHIIPRYHTDSQPTKSIWELDQAETCQPKFKADPAALSELADKLGASLAEVRGEK